MDQRSRRPADGQHHVRVPKTLSDAHAPLILEERLRERQEAEELPTDMDVTAFALQLLVAAETENACGPDPSRMG